MFDVPDPLVVHVLLLTHELCMIIFASLIIGILSVTDVFMCPKHTDNILFKLFMLLVYCIGQGEIANSLLRG